MCVGWCAWAGCSPRHVCRWMFMSGGCCIGGRCGCCGWSWRCHLWSMCAGWCAWAGCSPRHVCRWMFMSAGCCIGGRCGCCGWSWRCHLWSMCAGWCAWAGCSPRHVCIGGRCLWALLQHLLCIRVKKGISKLVIRGLSRCLCIKDRQGRRHWCGRSWRSHLWRLSMCAGWCAVSWSLMSHCWLHVCQWLSMY